MAKLKPKQIENFEQLATADFSARTASDTSFVSEAAIARAFLQSNSRTEVKIDLAAQGFTRTAPLRSSSPTANDRKFDLGATPKSLAGQSYDVEVFVNGLKVEVALINRTEIVLNQLDYDVEIDDEVVVVYHADY